MLFSAVSKNAFTDEHAETKQSDSQFRRAADISKKVCFCSVLLNSLLTVRDSPKQAKHQMLTEWSEKFRQTFGQLKSPKLKKMQEET